MLNRLSSQTQPYGFSICFWLRLFQAFSYYGIQPLLVLYLTKFFHFQDKNAYSLVTTFIALSTVMPVFSGIIARKINDLTIVITYGVILISFGIFLISFPKLIYFNLGLAVICVGSGFVNGSLPTLLGSLYFEKDKRRELGFSLYYMAINIGALFSTLICAWISDKIGWEYGFWCASFGGAIGLLFILFNATFFKNLDKKNQKNIRVKELPYIKYKLYLLSGTIILFTFLFYLFLIHANWINAILLAVSIFIAAYLYGHYDEFNLEEMQKLKVLLFFLFCSILVSSVAQQTILSYMLFTERFVDRQLWHTSIPAAAFVSCNPAMVIIFTPLIHLFERKLRDYEIEFSIPSKFIGGFLLISLSFLVLKQGGVLVDGNKLSMAWLLMSYALLSLGEILVIPSSYALVIQLAPAKLRGFLMGVWFFSMAIADKFAGVIAGFSLVASSSATLKDYMHLFGGIGHGLLLFTFIIAAIMISFRTSMQIALE